MSSRSRTIESEDQTPDAEIKAEIGRRIAERRKKLGLSAQRIAERMGVSREAITQIENGRNNITAVSVWKLATLLSCDVGLFFPEVPDGYALTKVDQQKLEEEGGKKAARWAQELFASKPKADTKSK